MPSRSFEIRKTHGGPNPPASRNEPVAVPETVDKIGLMLLYIKKYVSVVEYRHAKENNGQLI